MIKELRQLSTKLVSENPYWQYRHDSYELPNGNEGQYYYVHTRGSVFIVPQVEDGRYVLLRQYRYLNRRESIEFPGGGIAEGVDILEQAQRELQEEAGYRAGKMEYLGAFNPMNGVTDELCHVYHATALQQVEATPEESEEFEMVLMDAAEIRDAIRRNELWDGMTLAAWALVCA